MNEDSGSDLSTIVAHLLVVLVLVAIIISLIPVLFQVAWHNLPGVLILVLIVAVLRGMVKKLLG